MTVTKVTDEPLRSIIENCHRLIKDAGFLLSKGSPGSALSLAILAFEEAGKGHHLDMSIPKTKRTPSWHQFRQFISAFSLHASVFQKYDLDFPQLSENAKKILEDRYTGVKKSSDLDDKPFPQEVREEIESHIRIHYNNLEKDDALICSVEIRWVRKILIAAMSGSIEGLRQKGMYVDFKDDAITSTPNEVDKKLALHWLQVAERSLALLECGNYDAPYGNLADLLEKMPRPLPEMDVIRKLIQDLQSSNDHTLEELSSANVENKD